MLKKRLYINALTLAVLLTPTAGNAQTRIVAVGDREVILSNGDVKVRFDRCSGGSDTTWTGGPVNIFVSAGEARGSREIASGWFGPGMNSCCGGAITTGGDMYDGGTCTAFYYSGNIFAIAGRAPGIIAEYAQNFAVTTTGDYYGVPRYGTWMFMGNIFEQSPTPAAQPTFGQLKAQYRK